MRRHTMQSYMRSAQAGEEFQDEAGEGRPEQEGMSPDNNGWDNALRDEALMPEDAGAAADQAQADAEARLKAEVEELRLRAAAEMENFKKRLTREHQEQMRYAAENVLSDLLPTLDNLDLALHCVALNHHGPAPERSSRGPMKNILEAACYQRSQRAGQKALTGSA